jgi:cyclic pyranopterin phosphate synthase
MSDSMFKAILHSDRLKQIAETYNADPVCIEIDPTNACNHNCTFCCTIVNNRKNVCQLDYVHIEKLLEDLAERGTVQSVSWKGGGEPTIYNKLGDAILKAASLGLAQGLTTNGSCLSKVESVGRQYLSWVRVSLDAATPETHQNIHVTTDFKSIVGQVKDYASGPRKGRIGLNMTVVQANIDEVEKFVLLGLSLNVDYVAIRPAYYDCFGFDCPVSEAERNIINTKLTAIKDIPTGKMDVYVGQMGNAGRVGSYVPDLCLAPILRPVVGADGEVYACCDLRGHLDYSFGNIKEQGFWEIWDGERRQEVLQKAMNKQCIAHCSFPYDFYNRILDYLRDENKVDSEFL